jgi:hypothetical protein
MRAYRAGTDEGAARAPSSGPPSDRSTGGWGRLPSLQDILAWYSGRAVEGSHSVLSSYDGGNSDKQAIIFCPKIGWVGLQQHDRTCPESGPVMSQTA